MAVSEMPTSRVAVPPAFRRQLVELVRSGRTPEEPAGRSTLRAVDPGLGEGDGGTSPRRPDPS
jgi:hypothetical protein